MVSDMTWFTTDQHPSAPGALLRLLRLWSVRADCTPDLENTFLASGIPWDAFARVRPKLWDGAALTLDATVGADFPVSAVKQALEKGFARASFDGGSLSYTPGKVTLRLDTLDRGVVLHCVRAMTRLDDPDRLRSITEHLLTQPRAVWRLPEDAIELSQVEFGREFAAKSDTAPLFERWAGMLATIEAVAIQLQLRRLAPAALDAAIRAGSYSERSIHLHAGPGAVVADVLPLIEELAADEIDELKAETSFGSVKLHGRAVRTQFRVLYDSERGPRAAVWSANEAQAGDVAAALGAALSVVETS